MPTPCAPPMSATGRSPTNSVCAGSAPTRWRACRNISAAGLAAPISSDTTMASTRSDSRQCRTLDRCAADEPLVTTAVLNPSWRNRTSSTRVRGSSGVNCANCVAVAIDSAFDAGQATRPPTQQVSIDLMLRQPVPIPRRHALDELLLVGRPPADRQRAVPVPAHPDESAGAVQQSVVEIEQDRLDLASARHLLIHPSSGRGRDRARYGKQRPPPVTTRAPQPVVPAWNTSQRGSPAIGSDSTVRPNSVPQEKLSAAYHQYTHRRVTVRLRRTNTPPGTGGDEPSGLRRVRSTVMQFERINGCEGPF